MLYAHISSSVRLYNHDNDDDDDDGLYLPDYGRRRRSMGELLDYTAVCLLFRRPLRGN